jgi:hypothetical protein
VVHSGWFDKRFPEADGWSGFVWKINRTAFVGECVTYPEIGNIQHVTFQDGQSFPTGGINTPPAEGQMVIYTPDYGGSTPKTSINSVEVTVEMKIPAGILPKQYTFPGTIINVNSGYGGTPIPYDAVVLTGVNNAATFLSQNAHNGEAVNITQEVDSWDEATCKTTDLGTVKDWSNAYASVGGAYGFLQAGKVDPDSGDPSATDTTPRTAILMNSHYIFFMVVEGVEKPVSQGGEKGMSFGQMGDFGKNVLGATDGIAEDGGGSSTMVINGNLVNQPSCEDQYVGTPDCERKVVDGMLMVVQEPKQVSDLYNPGDVTPTKYSTAVRLGPGTNYGQIDTLAAHSNVTILHDIHDLDGVLAKNQTWWKVQSGGMTGWISQIALNGKEIMLPFVRR